MSIFFFHLFTKMNKRKNGDFGKDTELIMVQLLILNLENCICFIKLYDYNKL